MPGAAASYEAFGMVPRELSPRVGVVDSGWEKSIVDARIKRGRSFVNSRAGVMHGDCEDTNDQCGHGTACAQIILAIAPSTEIVPVRVFGETTETSPASLLDALDWAGTQSLDLLSLSLATVDKGSRNQLYRRCEALRRAGTTLVASTFRHSNGGYPAVFDNVIGVALSASVIQGQLVWAVPGIVDFVVAADALLPYLDVYRRRAIASTSVAAAFVTGHAASVLSECGRLEPTTLYERLSQRLGLLRTSGQ